MRGGILLCASLPPFLVEGGLFFEVVVGAAGFGFVAVVAAAVVVVFVGGGAAAAAWVAGRDVEAARVALVPPAA